MDTTFNIPQATKSDSTDELWKIVAFGAVPGILLGAGSFYTAERVYDDIVDAMTPTDEPLQVASVSDSVSFGEAFASARAQVGPGGVFHWHGGIYNTYTKEEWDAMSAADKDAFAQAVRPEVRPDEINTEYVTEATPTITVHHTAEPQPHAIATTGHAATAPTETYEVDDQQAMAATQPDVQIVGQEVVYDANGQPMNVAYANVNGRMVAIVDVDHDGEPDVLMCDANGNGVLDHGEMVDAHTGEDLTDALMQQQDPSLGQNDVAPDMPDYMNDVDPTMI